MFKILIELALLSLLAATAFAGSDPPPAPGQDLHSGPVMGVMPEAIMVMDERHNEMETIAVSPQTKITLNGQPASLVDIQMGDLATVTIRPMDQNLTAVAIHAVRRL